MSLLPLPYHSQVLEYFRSHEAELLKWHSLQKFTEEDAQSIRLGLLKTHYRLEPQAHPEAHQALKVAVNQLGIQAPVTLYQSQDASSTPNAALVYVPNEAHIVLEGPILSQLNPEEMTALFGHELSHYLLWAQDHQTFLSVERLLQALLEEPRAEKVHLQSFRRWRLFTEILADRGSWQVTQDTAPIISCLVKVQTQLKKVDPVSYQRQADEIFTQSSLPLVSEGISHPELYIRTRALTLWTQNPSQALEEIERMIHGPYTWNAMDLLDQEKLHGWTRTFLDKLLSPSWLQTEATLHHARQFFPDYQFPEAIGHEPLSLDNGPWTDHTDPLLNEYFWFILLDFATVDPELETKALAHVKAFAQSCSWKEGFAAMIKKHLARR